MLFSGCFPSNWKISFLKHITKGIDSTNTVNYRPIYIILVIPKLFASIVSEEIYPLLAPLLNYDQHGFSKDKSTATILIIFQKYVLTHLPIY